MHRYPIAHFVQQSPSQQMNLHLLHLAHSFCAYRPLFPPFAKAYTLHLTKLPQSPHSYHPTLINLKMSILKPSDLSATIRDITAYIPNDTLFAGLRALPAETLSNFLVVLLTLAFAFICDNVGRYWRSGPWCFMRQANAMSASRVVTVPDTASPKRRATRFPHVYAGRQRVHAARRTYVKGRRVLVQGGFVLRAGSRRRG